MKKNNTVYLQQIIQYVDEIKTYIKGISFKEFEKSGLL